MNQIIPAAYRTGDQIKVVAMVGAGSIGNSWAALYLAHGYEVVVTDPAPAFEQESRRFVTDAWPALRRLQPTAAAMPPLQLLSFAASPAEAAKRSDLVHENAPENPQLKIRLIAELDAVMPKECLILSSTSGIGATLLQSQCRFPGRVVVAHPFNPPHLIPLVEIVGGGATDPTAVQCAKTFLRGLGKRPIVLRREVIGHLANRLQAALLRDQIDQLRRLELELTEGAVASYEMPATKAV